MKKNVILALSLFALVACGGGASEGAIDTTDNAAKTYCELATKAENAEGEEKEKLEKELGDLENRIEKEHDGDEAWFNEFEDKIESTCQEG